MIVVRPAKVRPMFLRGVVAVRQVAIAGARGMGMALGQVGEAGPAVTLLSLGLAAGVGVLALRLVVQHGMAMPERVYPRSSTVLIQAAPAQQHTRPSLSGSMVQLPTPVTVILTASPEQAATVIEAQEEANAIRISSAEPPLPYEVVVIASAGDEQRFRLELAEADMERAYRHESQAVVIDLRPSTQSVVPHGVSVELVCGVLESEHSC